MDLIVGCIRRVTAAEARRERRDGRAGLAVCPFLCVLICEACATVDSVRYVVGVDA